MYLHKGRSVGRSRTSYPRSLICVSVRSGSRGHQNTHTTRDSFNSTTNNHTKTPLDTSRRLRIPLFHAYSTQLLRPAWSAGSSHGCVASRVFPGTTALWTVHVRPRPGRLHPLDLVTARGNSSTTGTRFPFQSLPWLALPTASLARENIGDSRGIRGRADGGPDEVEPEEEEAATATAAATTRSRRQRWGWRR